MKLEDIKKNIIIDFNCIPKNLLCKYKFVLFRWSCSEGHFETLKQLYYMKNQTKKKINLLYHELDIYKCALDHNQLEIFQWLFQIERMKLAHQVELFQYALGKSYSLIIAQWIYSRIFQEEFSKYLNVKETLGWICEQNHPDIFDWVLSIIPKIDSESYSNAFMIACYNGHLELAQKIYLLGEVDLYYRHTGCFRFTISSGYLEIAKWIYSLGDINVNDTVNSLTYPQLYPEMETALHLTIEYGKWETAELKDNCIEFSIYDNTDILKNKLDCIKWLISVGVIVQKCDFDFALSSGYLEIAKILLEHVVDLDELDGLAGSFADSLSNQWTDNCDWLFSINQKSSHQGADLYLEQYFTTHSRDESLDLENHIGINYLLDCKESNYFKNHQKMFEKLCFGRNYKELIKEDTPVSQTFEADFIKRFYQMYIKQK